MSITGIKFSTVAARTITSLVVDAQEWFVETGRIERSAANTDLAEHMAEFFAEISKLPERTRRVSKPKMTAEEKEAKAAAKKEAQGEWSNPKRFQTADGKQHRSCIPKKDGTPGAWLRVKQHIPTGKWLMCVPKNWGDAEKILFADLYGEEAKVEKPTKSIIKKLKAAKKVENTTPPPPSTPPPALIAAPAEEKSESPEEKLLKKAAAARALKEKKAAEAKALKEKKEAEAKALKEAQEAKSNEEPVVDLEEEEIQEDVPASNDTFEHEAFPGLTLRKDGDMIYDASTNDLVGMEDESGDIITV